MDIGKLIQYIRLVISNVFISLISLCFNNTGIM